MLERLRADPSAQAATAYLVYGVVYLGGAVAELRASFERELEASGVPRSELPFPERSNALRELERRALVLDELEDRLAAEELGRRVALFDELTRRGGATFQIADVEAARRAASAHRQKRFVVERITVTSDAGPATNLVVRGRALAIPAGGELVLAGHAPRDGLVPRGAHDGVGEEGERHDGQARLEEAPQAEGIQARMIAGRALSEHGHDAGEASEGDGDLGDNEEEVGVAHVARSPRCAAAARRRGLAGGRCLA